MLKRICPLLLVASSGCLGIDISGHGSGASGGTGATAPFDAGTVEVFCGLKWPLQEPLDGEVGEAVVLCRPWSQPGFSPQTLDAGLSVGLIPATTPCSVLSQRPANEAVIEIDVGCPKPYTALYAYADIDGYDVVLMPNAPDGG